MHPHLTLLAIIGVSLSIIAAWKGVTEPRIVLFEQDFHIKDRLLLQPVTHATVVLSHGQARHNLTLLPTREPARFEKPWRSLISEPSRTFRAAAPELEAETNPLGALRVEVALHCPDYTACGITAPTRNLRVPVTEWRAESYSPCNPGRVNGTCDEQKAECASRGGRIRCDEHDIGVGPDWLDCTCRYRAILRAVHVQLTWRGDVTDGARAPTLPDVWTAQVVGAYDAWWGTASQRRIAVRRVVVESASDPHRLLRHGLHDPPTTFIKLLCLVVVASAVLTALGCANLCPSFVAPLSCVVCFCAAVALACAVATGTAGIREWALQSRLETVPVMVEKRTSGGLQVVAADRLALELPMGAYLDRAWLMVAMGDHFGVDHTGISMVLPFHRSQRLYNWDDGLEPYLIIENRTRITVLLPLEPAELDLGEASAARRLPSLLVPGEVLTGAPQEQVQALQAEVDVVLAALAVGYVLEQPSPVTFSVELYGSHRNTRADEEAFVKQVAVLRNTTAVLQAVARRFGGAGSQGRVVKAGQTREVGQRGGLIEAVHPGATHPPLEPRSDCAKWLRDQLRHEDALSRPVPLCRSTYRGAGSYFGVADVPGVRHDHQDCRCLPTQRGLANRTWTLTPAQRATLRGAHGGTRSDVRHGDLTDNGTTAPDSFGPLPPDVATSESIVFVHGLPLAMLHEHVLQQRAKAAPHHHHARQPTTSFEVIAGNVTDKAASCLGCAIFAAANNRMPSAVHLGRADSFSPPCPNIRDGHHPPNQLGEMLAAAQSASAAAMCAKWNATVARMLRAGVAALRRAYLNRNVARTHREEASKLHALVRDDQDSGTAHLASLVLNAMSAPLARQMRRHIRTVFKPVEDSLQSASSTDVRLVAHV